jgi:hypothetical protein
MQVLFLKIMQVLFIKTMQVLFINSHRKTPYYNLFPMSDLKQNVVFKRNRCRI